MRGLSPSVDVRGRAAVAPSMKRTTALALFALSVSCTQAAPRDESIQSARRTGSAELVARLARLPLFAGTLATGKGPSEATLPSRAADAVRVTPKSDPNAWVEIETLDAHPVVADEVDGTRVYLGAAKGTDLLRAPLANGFEEIRWLRDATAASSFRQRLRTGPAIAVLRIREGHVEAVDARGYVHVATAPMLAVDAKGVQRMLSVSLEADGHTVVASLDTAGLAYPIGVDPLWSTTASVNTPRTGGTLVGIGNRKAILAGGTTTGAVGTTELYDAATNTWTTKGSMALARTGATGAFLSASNRVLVCGGTDAASATTASCERFDVVAGTWSAAAAMSTARLYFRLVPHSAGAKVLLVDDKTQSYGYDGAANTWTTIASLIPTAPLFTFATATLADGRIMVAGGGSLPPPGVASVTNSAASIFNPATSTWSATAAMSEQRLGARAVTVSGKVYVFGGMRWCSIPSGYTGCNTRTTEIWNPATGTWSAGPEVAQGPIGAYALANGLGYVFEQKSIWELITAGSSSFTTAGTDGPTATNSAQISTTEVLFVGSNGTGNTLFSLGTAGSTCVFGFECGTGNCTGGACCNTATCPAGFVCNGPTKPGSCVKLVGDKCSANTDCDSGFCTDGVCCNSACGGQCQACDVPGKAGTCTAVFGPPHGTRTACAGTGSADACLRMACNGADVAACHYPGAGVPCGSASCSAGVETHVGACDGAGKCSDVPKSCGSYSCGPTACKSTCSSPPECVAGYYCDMTKAACVPLTGLGRKCDATTPCNSGLFCTDGVCCGKSSCGAGGSCALSGKEGTCYRMQGFSCSNALDCGSGHCVDGVCCATACDGQCEACDAKGAEGTCTPITGKPHGLRTACSTDPTSECGAAVCDGSKRDGCAGFVGSDVECREATCAAGVMTTRATCDGKGACPAAITTPCDGYQCDPDGLACLGSCTVDAECLDGFTCLGARCIKKTALCNSDNTAVLEVDGSRTACVSFRCKAGTCLTECATTEDCQSGLACNPDSKKCEAPTAGDDSGCSLGHSSRSGAPALALFAALSLLGLVRRVRS